MSSDISSVDQRDLDTQEAPLIPSGTNLLADIAGHLETPDDLTDAEAAAARFDVSPFRLWLLFQSVDENQDGFISKSELLDALTSPTVTNQSNHSTKSIRKPLLDIQALDELYDRLMSAENPSRSFSSPSDEKDDEKTTAHQNFVPNQFAGLTFPQFSRIMRYLWLQQLLRPELDNPSDPDSHYCFECIDYSSGYYSHKKITGNMSEKKTRKFFTAPRHGNARMRWIDVPSGTLPESLKAFEPSKFDHRNSFRITMLRLAVKYRFHPTSIEDAIDLDYQEPKVNSFEHSLLDLGNFNCGTISWLRDAGQGPDEQLSYQQVGGWARHDRIPSGTISLTDFNPRNSAPSLPRSRPALRESSTASFHSYHNDPIFGRQASNVPDFVMAEGVDDMSMNEGRHYFITIPMFELSRKSQTSLEMYKEVSQLLPSKQLHPLIIEINEATLGIFVASLPDANLVVTCSTKWRPTRIKPFKDYLQAMNGLPDCKPALQKSNGNDAGGNNNNSSRDGSEDDRLMQALFQDEKRSLQRVKDLLKKRHAIQRHRNGNWLMHALMDAVVDNLVPITKIYEAQLQRVSARLYELQHRISKEEVKEIIVMKGDLEWLQHELRPFSRVIRHLIDDRNIGIEVTHYLQDIEDHLFRTFEELNSYANQCASLKDEYHAYLDRRMNDMFIVLTVVTTLIVPGQFLSSYYGMNFEDPETGDPAIPLLTAGTSGVAAFWGMTFGFTFILICLLYYLLEREHK